MIDVSFVDGISELALVKMLDKKVLSTLRLKLKFVQNLVTLDVTNSFLKTGIFDPKEMLDTLEFRWIGY